MNKNLSLLDLYCREYGMEIEFVMRGGANSPQEAHYLVALPSSITYIGRVTKECLENMSESEIENFVIKCAMECIVK